MILIVAPFDGNNPEKSPFIAASKKIHLIIHTLSSIDNDIVLLNSSHWLKTSTNFKIERKQTYLNCNIYLVTPKTLNFKFLGKLMNLFSIKSIYSKIINEFGKPKIIWLYNGYAFESRFATFAKKKLKNDTKIILEFEDWHFARSRGYNPKPYIDWFFWKLLLKHIDYSFTVNKFLENKVSKHVYKNTLLPGLINDNIINDIDQNNLFKNKTISIGYFGGLSKEKGAKFILNLMKEKFDIDVKFIICGSGDLQEDFNEFSINNPLILEYFGTITEEELNNLYKRIDIIINPHFENNGVFPFKVIEAIAMKKLLISTTLDVNGFNWISDAIEFRELSIKEFKYAINNSKRLYNNKKQDILEISNLIENKYSCNSLHDYIVKNIIN